jgi:hypothetical protein
MVNIRNSPTAVTQKGTRFSIAAMFRLLFHAVFDVSC